VLGEKDMKYRIYFIAFGRKLKMDVEADSKSEAMHLIRNQIEILKVEEIGGYSEDETVDMLKGMFGMK